MGRRLISSFFIGDIVMGHGSLRLGGVRAANSTVFASGARQYRRRMKEADEPLPQEVHSRQAVLVFAGLLKEMRLSFATSIDRMNQRSHFSQDTVIRHHLVSMTKEVSEIGRQFDARFAKLFEAQGVAAAMDVVFAHLHAKFPERICYARDSSIPRDVISSWVSVQLFCLLAQDSVEFVVQSTGRSSGLAVRLAYRDGSLSLVISSVELEVAAELCLYLDREQLRQRLAALSGRVVRRENAVAITCVKHSGR
jgi:hypothetical protein